MEQASTVEGRPEGGREGKVGGPHLQAYPRLDPALPHKDLGDSPSRLAASKIPNHQGPKLALPPSLPPLTFSPSTGGGGREGGREGGRGIGLHDVLEAVMRGGGNLPPEAPRVEPLVSKSKGVESK